MVLAPQLLSVNGHALPLRMLIGKTEAARGNLSQVCPRCIMPPDSFLAPVPWKRIMVGA